MMKRYNFTLIEVLICLALLIGIGGLFSVKGIQLLSERRSLAGMKKLSDELFLTEALAVTHQMDIELIISQQGNAIVLERKADYIPPSCTKYFTHLIKCQNLILEGKEKRTIHLYGNGWVDDPSPLFLHTLSRKSKIIRFNLLGNS